MLLILVGAPSKAQRASGEHPEEGKRDGTTSKRTELQVKNRSLKISHLGREMHKVRRIKLKVSNQIDDSDRFFKCSKKL